MPLILLRIIFGALLTGLLCLCVAGWQLALKQTRGQVIPKWRFGLQAFGLIGASFSYLSYVVMLLHGILVASGRLAPIEVIAFYRRFHPFEIAAASIPFSTFGRKGARVAAVTAGVLMAFLWLYLYY